MLCLGTTFSVSLMLCVNQSRWVREPMTQSFVHVPSGPFRFEIHTPSRETTGDEIPSSATFTYQNNSKKQQSVQQKEVIPQAQCLHLA